jgi:dTDP-4-amino-4,6-dideoxygalactose transaminase
MSKSTVLDLAIFGAEPEFPEKLHVGRPNLGDRQRLLVRINEIIDRRWFTNNGEYVQEFERRVAQLAGVKHAIATCNGAVGLEIGIRALGLTGEVIVPSFTFIATAHALEWQGITPVFADIDPRTHLLDVESVARRITPRTAGIIGVHLWSQVCEIEPLEALARRHGLKLMFDAAHAFGASRRGLRVGSFGDLEVFSFHATKFVNSLEGGAVVTDSDELARRVRLMKNFGFLGYDDVGYVGTNGKMNEISAAMGLTSIEAMDEIISINERNHRAYAAELSGLDGVRVIDFAPDQQVNYQYVVAEIDETCPIPRDRLLDVLWAENVIARRYFYPGCHRMEPYRSRRSPADDALPATCQAAARVLVLPTGQAMSRDDIHRLCGVIRLAVANGADIVERLAGSGTAVHLDAFA